MLWWWMSVALAGTCETTTLDALAEVPPPAVFVLGERHGHQPDLRRATRLVNRLSGQAPVTVALEAVHHNQQPVLDAFARGEVPAPDLPELMDWSAMWGFRYRPYEALVTGAQHGWTVVGAGLDLGPKPDEAEVLVPSGYLDLLRPAMGDHPMPLGMEQRFVESMAWRDHGLAQAGLQAWNGSGYLVYVVGRGHVEGSKGVNWQVQQQSSAPVHSVVLAQGGKPPCWPGDVIWR